MTICETYFRWYVVTDNSYAHFLWLWITVWQDIDLSLFSKIQNCLNSLENTQMQGRDDEYLVMRTTS